MNSLAAIFYNSEIYCPQPSEH
uniref:Uncharacterized protein n=1 Tax=Arundo donax TaxID=35708 RepID=A0A0A8XP84_ARUDO